MLFLLRQPFVVSDQIVSGGHEETVERIETRPTHMETCDERPVVIPKSNIHSGRVVVDTDYDT